MEINKSNEVKVGILVAATLAVTIAVILFLGGDSKFFTKKAHLQVRFDQAQGLAQGAVVTVLGVQVGHVQDIQMVEVDGKTNLNVILEVEDQFRTRITQGSTAGVRTQGALGDKFVYITPGPPEAAPIAELGFLQSEQGSGFFETLAENTAKIERLFDLISEVHKLVSAVNGNGQAAAFMNNMVATSENLKRMTSEGGKVGGAVEKMANIMTKIDNGSGTLGALVNDSSVYEGLKQLVGGAPRNKYFKNIIRETIQTGEK